MSNLLTSLADLSAQGSSNSSISYNEQLLNQGITDTTANQAVVGQQATTTNGAVAGVQAAPSGDAITGSTALQPTSVEATTSAALTPQTDPVTGSAQGSPSPRQLYLVFLDGVPHGNAQALGLRIRSDLGITRPDALFEHLNGFAVMLTADQAQRLQHSRGVLSVEADTMVSLVVPVDTQAAPGQTSGTVSATAVQTTPYGVSMVWGGNLNYSTANNNGKYAFVLDTGISTQTGDLNVNSTYSRNYTSTSRTDWIDYHGHGTHVAGTIAAINDADGVVGVAAGANVISIRVLNRQGSGQTSWIVNGINYVAGLVKTGALSSVGVNNLVANMSLGGGLNSTIDNAVRAAATPDSQGRYLRFALAAGNSGADADSYSPASTGDALNVYTVSAVDSNNVMASWSNYDSPLRGDSIDDVDFSAPGVGVVSLGMSAGRLVTMSGTSMSSPHMAGVLLMGTPLPGSMSTANSGGMGDPLVYLA